VFTASRPAGGAADAILARCIKQSNKHFTSICEPRANTLTWAGGEWTGVKKK